MGDIPKPGATLMVKVKRVSFGLDGKIYVVIEHPEATNCPSFVWKEVIDA